MDLFRKHIYILYFILLTYVYLCINQSQRGLAGEGLVKIYLFFLNNQLDSIIACAK
jgi:hypothetical protein